jgi:hypothetical protein
MFWPYSIFKLHCSNKFMTGAKGKTGHFAVNEARGFSPEWA